MQACDGGGDGDCGVGSNGEDSSGGDDPVRQVVVGICAMEKKSLSKPMTEILTRIEEFEYISTIIFPEDVILSVSNAALEFLTLAQIVETFARCILPHLLII